MKWYENWIEVFKSGTHTDSAGNTRTWTNEDLDKIVENFSKNGDVPVVLGHPKTDEPAYAWVFDLKRENDTLFAKLDKVDEEFSAWVEKGLYRKISVALDENLNLRHVGFLGAANPAVKGLKNNFAEEFKRFFALNPEKPNKISYYEGFSLFSQNLQSKNFFVSEKLPKTATRQEFTAQIEELERKLAFAEKVNQQKDLDAFLDSLQKEAKITAEDKEPLSEVLQSLYCGHLGQFSECDSQTDGFVRFLNNLPKRCEFGEIATNSNALKGTYRTPQEELGLKIADSLKNKA